MADQNYYWTSTGGDELCDAMAGVHVGYEPARPHPNCCCLVEAIGTETGFLENRSEDSCYRIYSELLDVNYLTGHQEADDGTWVWDELPPRFEVIGHYEIVCIDHEGNETTGVSMDKSGEIDGPVEDGDVDFFDLIAAAEEWVAEQIPEVEAEAEGLCPSCRGPSIT